MCQIGAITSLGHIRFGGQTDLNKKIHSFLKIAKLGIAENIIPDPLELSVIGANQVTLEDSGAHTVNGFVTGISPGPVPVPTWWRASGKILRSTGSNS